MNIELIRRWGPWFALAVAAVAAYYPRFIKFPNGMTLYPQAAECMRMQEIMLTCAYDFTYPPAFGFLMMPFVPMPLGLRNLVWYAITLGAMVVSFWLCDNLVRRLYPGPWERKELIWLRVASLLLIAKFMLAVLENQAYDVLPLMLVLGGIFWLATERPLAGAASLAVAAAIKATPLLFLPYLVLKRRFLAAACFVAVFLVVSILPDLFFTPQGAEHGYLISWIRTIASPALRDVEGDAPNHFWAGLNLLNHSLRGGVARMMDEYAHPQLFKVALYGTWLAFLAVLGILLTKSATKSPQRDEFVVVDGALLFIGTLMLSPMTSRSHYVFLLLPYYVLVAAVIRDASMRRLGGLALVASFVLLTATSNDVVGRRVTEWAYQTGQLVIGALVLMVGVAAIVLRRPLTDDLRDVEPGQRVRQTSSDATT
jgi:uncharacterized membrane protein